MRYILILFILFPLVCNSQVIKEEDEFTGRVSWKSDNPKVIDVEDGEIMRALYMASYSDNNWLLALYAVSTRGESIYDNKRVYFLVDGERIQIEVAKRDLDYESTALVSYLALLPTKDEFSKIGFADEVRVKAGNNIFSLSKEVRTDMRRIMRLVSEELGQN